MSVEDDVVLESTEWNDERKKLLQRTLSAPSKAIATTFGAQNVLGAEKNMVAVDTPTT